MLSGTGLRLIAGAPCRHAVELLLCSAVTFFDTCNWMLRHSMPMESARQDDFLPVIALAGPSHEFVGVDSTLAHQVWCLAVVIAAEHGVTPGEAAQSLELAGRGASARR